MELSEGDAPCNSELNDGSGSNWELSEKKLLLKGLKLYGASDVERIAKMIGTKDEVQIKLYISETVRMIHLRHAKMRRAAYFSTRKKKLKMSELRTKQKESLPLTKNELVVLKNEEWEMALADGNCYYNPDYLSPLARAFKYISRFETHPSPTLDGIDFRAAYAFISKVVSGHCCMRKEMWPDPRTSRFIRESFQHLVDMAPDNYTLPVILPNHGADETETHSPNRISDIVEPANGE